MLSEDERKQGKELGEKGGGGGGEKRGEGGRNDGALRREGREGDISDPKDARSYRKRRAAIVSYEPWKTNESLECARSPSRCFGSHRWLTEVRMRTDTVRICITVSSLLATEQGMRVRWCDVELTSPVSIRLEFFRVLSSLRLVKGKRGCKAFKTDPLRPCVPHRQGSETLVHGRSVGLSSDMEAHLDPADTDEMACCARTDCVAPKQNQVASSRSSTLNLYSNKDSAAGRSLRLLQNGPLRRA